MTTQPQRTTEEEWVLCRTRLALGWGVDKPVPRTAVLFLAAHPWIPIGHLGELVGIHTTGVGVTPPWCDECADWHGTDQPHSTVSEPEVLEFAKQRITPFGQTEMVTLS